MKILLAELWPEKGHLRLIEELSDILSRKFDVYSVLPRSVTKINNKNIIIAPYDYYIRNSNYKIFDILDSLKYMARITSYIKTMDSQHAFDIIIFVTYNEFGFFCLRHLLKKDIILMNHNNIDFVNKNKIKKYMFNTFAKKVKHIVQARFIADYMNKNLGISTDNIAIWMHPLNINNGIQARLFDCVGISNSNDERIVENIIDLEIKNEFIKNNGLKVILRSKKHKYNNGFLEVINGFIPLNNYNYYISNAKCIFMPFSHSFQYRMSGTLVDAFSNFLPVISTETVLYKNVKTVYPNIIYPFDITNFPETIKSISKNTDSMLLDFRKFHFIHSNDNLEKEMTLELNNLLNKQSDYTDVDF